MGLRERKKQQVRQRLLDAAIELARAKGLDRLRVRDIAEAAEVSEATFFNYFASKDALLAIWLHDRIANVFAHAGTAQASAGTRPRVRHALRSLAREVAGEPELFAAVCARGRACVSPEPVAELGTLIAAAQARGELRADVPAGALADLIEAGVLAVLARSLAGGESPPSESGLASSLQRASDVVLDGSRKRNERVRVRATSAPAPRA